jgi:hypothetical protein
MWTVKAAISDGGVYKQTDFSKRMKQPPTEHFTQKNIGSSIHIHGR